MPIDGNNQKEKDIISKFLSAADFVCEKSVLIGSVLCTAGLGVKMTLDRHLWPVGLFSIGTAVMMAHIIVVEDDSLRSLANLSRKTVRNTWARVRGLLPALAFVPIFKLIALPAA